MDTQKLQVLLKRFPFLENYLIDFFSTGHEEDVCSLCGQRKQYVRRLQTDKIVDIELTTATPDTFDVVPFLSVTEEKHLLMKGALSM